MTCNKVYNIESSHISSINVQYNKLSVCPSVGMRSTTVELTALMFSTSRLYTAADSRQLLSASSTRQPAGPTAGY